MPGRRRNQPVEAAAADPSGDERLLKLSRELREDVVNALVAEGEHVWDSLSRRLGEYVSRIEIEARGDAEELERRIRAEVTRDLATSLEARLGDELGKAFDRLRSESRDAGHGIEERLRQTFDRSLDELVAERVRTEFEAATERIAHILMIHRRQIDSRLDRELESIREELSPKVVLRRAERPSQHLAPHSALGALKPRKDDEPLGR